MERRTEMKEKGREMESEDYSAAEDADPFTTNKGRADRKRRFSETQIKSLESMFESQVKLEPRKKLQLARELGLQPRQVAIWFQNKRARWKSKQLEREYAALRADYDALLSSFDSLNKEKHLLVKQLQKLAGLMKRSPDGSSNDGDSDNGDGKGEEGRRDTKPSLLCKEEASDSGVVLYSDDEEKKLRYAGHEEDDLLYLGEPWSGGGGSYVASTDRRYCFDGSCSPENCCSTSPQWWESWPLTAD